MARAEPRCYARQIMGVISRGKLASASLVAFVVGFAGVLACGSSEAPAVPPSGEGDPAGDEPPAVVPVEERAAWAFPEGGVVVDAIPSSDNDVRRIDAFGNLWIRSCEGLFVANESEIRRYRYVDAPWERGGEPLFADRQGRVWYSSDRSLSVLEGGQWSEAPAREGAGFVVGSDGVAWAIKRGERSGDFTIGSIWPEASAPIAAPRWHFETFAGRNGGIWYRTSLTAASELWHFDGQRFSGPFTVDNGTFFYDSLDDTMGIVRWEQGELIKVTYDGADIVEVSRSAVDWRSALGRQSDGYLIARSFENELLVLDGEQTVPLPTLRRNQARGPLQGMLSAAGELYLMNDFGVFLYREGEARPMIEYARYAPPTHPWDGAGYGGALRAESDAATRADFEPEIPAIFGEKVRVTGFPYHVGFESPRALVVDGEAANVSVQIAPELYAFAAEHGLDVDGAENGDIDPNTADPNAPPWDLFGYLEPGPCYRPGEKTFHVIEAYPRAMPAAERAALEAELRERYPL